MDRNFGQIPLLPGFMYNDKIQDKGMVSLQQILNVEMKLSTDQYTMESVLFSIL